MNASCFDDIVGLLRPLTTEQRIQQEIEENIRDFHRTQRLTDECFSPIFANLAEFISENMQKVDVLISDERGARIPTWFIQSYLKHNSVVSPKTIFIPGGRIRDKHNTIKAQLQEELRECNTKKDDNLFFITEFISSGRTLDKFESILQKTGYTNTQFLSLYSGRERSYYDTKNLSILQEDETEHPPHMYHYAKFTGVRKNRKTFKMTENPCIPEWIVDDVRSQIDELVVRHSK